MTVTPQDVQADIDAGVTELKKTTSGYVKSPNGTHWVNGLGYIADARTKAGLLVSPPSPPPPPTPITNIDTPPVPVGNLLFNQVFAEIGKIDTSVWEGKHYKAPSGTQWDYLNHAHINADGDLEITSHKSSTGQWLSTFMAGIADNNHYYSGGRYSVVKAKFPIFAGCFPAPGWEWASSGNPETIWGNGPIEVDICEQLGKEPTKYHGTVHPWLPSGDHAVGQPFDTGVNLEEDFHVYGAAVYATKVDFYFDGKLMGTSDMSASGLNDLRTYKVVPCIDLDMGGWGGTIDPSITDASMQVKYFKSYALA